jgi:molybdenum cofactor biosynthesis protein B
MSYTAHQQAGRSITARCAIITLSDTRTEETDKSGQAIRQLLTAAGHTVTRYQILPDDPAPLGDLLDQHLASEDVDLILTNGGTGVSPRDQTLTAVLSRLHLPLPGFGELFRMLSFEQIGSGAMLSRATAGISASGKPIFALPGSTKAVELALNRLILPEIGHLLAELRKSNP